MTDIDLRDFGAIADGQSHKLSERYPTLAVARAKYPFATSLDDEIDRCAVQLAIQLNTGSGE